MRKLSLLIVVASLLLLPGVSMAEGITLLGVPMGGTDARSGTGTGARGTDAGDCYVGCEPKAGPPAKCAVACGDDIHNGTSALSQQGMTSIIFGPTTWEQCARKMRDLGFSGW